MKRIVEFSREAIFKEEGNLERLLHKRPLADGTYLLNSSIGRADYSYKACYDPRKEKVILEVEARNEEKLVEAYQEFLKWADVNYKAKNKPDKRKYNRASKISFQLLAKLLQLRSS